MASFHLIADLLREANYWAEKDGSDVIKEKHVDTAIAKRVYRVNLIEEKIQEMIEEGSILIDSDGAVGGQVNGLAVYNLGDHMFGKTSAGTWVKGVKDGQPKQVYIYQVADNVECMQKWSCQAVVAQTAFYAVIGWDLLQHGVWKATGVLGQEAFDPVPFMNKMGEYGPVWYPGDVKKK